jgi:hypothetical protein
MSEVVPLDGVRRRFHVLRGNQRFHLQLNRGGLAAGQPVRMNDALSELSLVLENRDASGAKEHRTEMSLAGLPAGNYQITADGQSLQQVTGGGTRQSIMLPVGKREIRIAIRKIG